MTVSRFGAMLVFGLVCLFCRRAGADTVTFKDGRIMEGKVVSQDDENITLKTQFGTQKIARRDVAKVEKGETALDEYQKRRDALKSDDLEGHLKLALWCKENKLTGQAKDLYRMVLVLEPNQPIANKELGNIQYNGTWYSPADLDKVKESENKAKGLVKYKGQWMPKEDVDKLEKGMKKVGDRWMTPDEEMQSKGYTKVDGKWVKAEDKERLEVEKKLEKALGVKPIVIFSAHFTVASMLSGEHTKQMSDRAEEIYRFFGVFFEGKPDHQFWMGRAQLYVLNNRNNYEDFVNFVLPEMLHDEDTRKFFLKSGAFQVTGPNISGTSIEEDKFQLNGVDHVVAHFLLAQYCGGRVPPWLYEGYASWMETKFDDASRVHCTTKTSYGDRSEIADKASSSKSWPELIRDSIETKTDTPLESMMNISLNQLDYEHLSKSWSIVSMLVENSKDAFISFIRKLRTGDQEHAFKEGLGMAPAEVDGKWHEWAMKQK
ncbi:MAG: hypothetical protein HYR85_13785 [Planctomycetes bacterium]|nr:hypothetical protein [Planctomycetota bacterium]MBI3845079.1 hypothetical protein [Planctomycetota bacterium]